MNESIATEIVTGIVDVIEIAADLQKIVVETGVVKVMIEFGKFALTRRNSSSRGAAPCQW